MVSGNKIVLLKQSIDSSTTTESAAQGLVPGAQGLIAYCKVSNHTDGTYTLTIEQSPDGENWETLQAVAAVSVDGFAKAIVTDSATFGIFRASLVSAGVTTGADVECSLYYNPNKS